MQIALSSIHIADVMIHQGDYVTAKNIYEEALTIIPVRGVRWGYAKVLSGMGDLAYYEGNYELAWQYHHDSLEIQKQNNTRIDTIRNLTALGRIKLAQDDIPASARYFLEGLQETSRLGFVPDILNILVGVAELCMQQGNLADAVRLSTIITKHIASSLDAKTRAIILLNQLEVKFFADDLDSHLHDSSQTNLDDMAVQYMNLLASLIAKPLIKPLSARELEVVRLVASGLTNKEIAGKLVLSVGTVKRHVYNISAKLDARNRTHAVERARELSLL